MKKPLPATGLTGASFCVHCKEARGLPCVEHSGGAAYGSQPPTGGASRIVAVRCFDAAHGPYTSDDDAGYTAVLPGDVGRDAPGFVRVWRTYLRVGIFSTVPPDCVQNGMVERNAGLPPERRIEFRVGIHLGDVVEESDGDLMGDAQHCRASKDPWIRPSAFGLAAILLDWPRAHCAKGIR